MAKESNPLRHLPDSGFYTYGGLVTMNGDSIVFEHTANLRKEFFDMYEQFNLPVGLTEERDDAIEQKQLIVIPISKKLIGNDYYVEQGYVHFPKSLTIQRNAVEIQIYDDVYQQQKIMTRLLRHTCDDFNEKVLMLIIK